MEEIYDFGLRLKKLREAHNMSPSQLARAAKISISTVLKYESEIRTPNSEIVKRLAKTLETTTDYLLGMPEAAAIAIYDLSKSQQETLKALVRVINRQIQANEPSNYMDEFK